MKIQLAFPVPAAALALAICFSAAAYPDDGSSLLDQSRELRAATRTAANTQD